MLLKPKQTVYPKFTGLSFLKIELSDKKVEIT